VGTVDSIAIVAGAGDLPVVLARRLDEINLLSSVIVAQGSAVRFDFLREKIFEIAPGKVGEFLDILRKNKIHKVIMIGRIDKQGFVEREGFDAKAMEMLEGLRDGMDLSIFGLLLKELEEAGVEVLPQDMYLKEMIIGKGVLTRRNPPQNQLEDALFGLDFARKLATMDIGQTIVIKNKTVLAVEAIEGTDETIKRGGLLGKKDSVVCKAARKNQDNRFDIPGIGMKTVETMCRHHCSLLAVEAGCIFLVSRDEVISLADKENISIIGL